MPDENRVGESKKQGVCFRCKEAKEVILFATRSFGTIADDGSQTELASSQTWCCMECFHNAVREQSHVHYI